MADQFFLIDGSAFVYRAYFAIRGLTDAQGRPTNAVFGFTRLLLKLLREHQPAYIVTVFDAPGKTFRDELYPEYKATRPPTPVDLISQIPWIDEVVEALNIPLLRIEGVEADDVIGTLARRVEAAGIETVIVTGDKDALQLVSERVKVYDPHKGERGVWYGPDEVKQRFGVPPARVIDVLGLMGDTADNVPGVRGIGEKTARDLLEKNGDIEGIYAHLDEIKDKVRQRLMEDRDIALLSRTLVTIRTDVPLPITVEACSRKELDQAKVAAVMSKLGFTSLLEELLPETSAAEETDYRLVLTAPELESAIAEMRQAGEFALDTETTSTDPMRAVLVGLSMSCRPGVAYYIPVGHTPLAMASLGAMSRDGAPLTRELALETLRPLLEDPALGKVGHNIKYDLIVLQRAGIDLAGITFDTMVSSYLTDPSRLRHNLDDICLHYLKRRTIPITDLIGKGSKTTTFDHVPIERACPYACEDADVTWRLAGVFRPLLRERGVERLFFEVELPLISVLARMEQAGIAVNLGVFEELKRDLEKRLGTLASEIFKEAGGPFQINSPKQLQEVLFGKLGLKPRRSTKTGYSTDVEVLEQLALEHPLPEKILEYRTLEKLRGTYAEALPKLIHIETGRIHTSFNQAVAATGRLSSSDPNLQNIPVRTELGRRIREGFVPGTKDRRLISADYSQIELRILAHLSGDAHLKEAFFKEADVHRDTAARMFGVTPEAITPDMRRRAKAVNFGVVYGITPFGLARNLGTSPAEAAQFIEQYFTQHPGVAAWIEATLARARQDGYVTTLLNRRRYVPEVNSSDMNTRKVGERIAVNTPVQGSAADIIKLAMLRLDAALQKTRAQLLLQVHDELLVEGPAENAHDIAGLMRQIMEEAVTLDVPLKVDVGIGAHWAELH